MPCDHPKNAMVFVEEKAFSAICKCNNCGQEFKIGGWLTRGAGKSLKEGAENGFSNGFWSAAFGGIFRKPHDS